MPTSVVTGQPLWLSDMSTAPGSHPLGLLNSQVEETFAVVREHKLYTAAAQHVRWDSLVCCAHRLMERRYR